MRMRKILISLKKKNMSNGILIEPMKGKVKQKFQWNEETMKLSCSIINMKVKTATSYQIKDILNC